MKGWGITVVQKIEVSDNAAGSVPSVDYATVTEQGEQDS